MSELQLSPLATAFSDLLYRKSGSEELRDLGTRIIAALEEGSSFIGIASEEETLLKRFPKLVSHYPENCWEEALLVLDGRRLYLVRQLKFELFCAEKIAARLKNPLHPLSSAPVLEDAKQNEALHNAAARDFAVITGGPGTGKTFVTAALIREELKRNPALKILPVAPTGKAAQCLSTELAGSGIAAGTLQRTFRQLYSGVFRVNEENPQNCDLLIVDESSMVSLEQCARLLDGLRPDTRLILIGDKQQLPAIESGAVLRDLCGDDAGLPQGTVSELSTNFRSKEAPGIVELAALMRDGKSSVAELTERIVHAESPDLQFRLESEECLKKAAGEAVSFWRELPALGKDGSVVARQKAFELIDSFRILTALRHGQEGCETWNKMVMKLLGFRSAFDCGMPLVITGNSQENQLFNGDVGIIFRTEQGAKVFLPNRETPVAIGELPGFEPAFAMTVHKAQGSGFGRVLFILPAKENEVLSRELFYTALTRARKGIEIIGTPEIVNTTLGVSCKRNSALAERIRAILKER